MKIALAQINTTVGDIAENTRKISTFAAQARAQNAAVVVFPEMAITGYPPLDLLIKEDFIEAQLRALETIARAAEGITIVLGFIDRNSGGRGKPLFNSAAVLANGRIASRHPKTLLPTYDVFDEGRYFEPGGPVTLAEIGGRKCAVTICEDLWNEPGFPEANLYARKPVDEAVEKGAAVIFNLSASPFHLDKTAMRERLAKAVAARHGRPVFYVNLIGGNDSLIFDGASFAVDSTGELAARAKSFEEDLLVVDCDFSNKGVLTGTLATAAQSRPHEARDALIIGLRDYLRKCGFEKALVGLSGGVDSAVVAALAVEALGAEKVWGIAMPSPYSSPGSIEDARLLAKNLGIRFDVMPINETFGAFLTTMKPLFGDLPANVAEENLQARIRGSLLMALSNKFGHLLLTTGNKSEMAVGYCTLYGDMNGGLAVIADVPKLLVYDIARTFNEKKELIPERTLTKAPSAELRPNQKDTDSLPPYEVLDPILAAYIEEEKDVPTIASETGADRALVERIVQMIDRAEYKRRQAPPALRITPKAFGFGRRLPIAQRYEIWKG